VEKWIMSYMLKGKKGAADKAKRIAKWLASHTYFKSHGRHIPRSDLVRRGLLVEKLEKDQKLQE
jgi:hypothetical protein